jgi:hypothetical protein
MNCRHCGSAISPYIAFTQPVEGGMAYAQVCPHCRRVLGLRPRVDGDPLPVPTIFNRRELNHLQFVRWRLASDCAAQIADSSPLHAA